MVGPCDTSQLEKARVGRGAGLPLLGSPTAGAMIQSQCVSTSSSLHPFSSLLAEHSPPGSFPPPMCYRVGDSEQTELVPESQGGWKAGTGEPVVLA